jgi:3-deoxy-D-manno-octulosonic-acid transferase
VWERAQRLDRAAPLLERLASSRPTLVAGSTWPSDEAALLPSFAEIRQSGIDARLIIAPHEPTDAHLTPIEQWASEKRLRLDRLDQATTVTEVVLVDRVGVLGDLYALADVAFVGGGFHDAGLHSVLEPAAFGAPVLFGPKHGTSRDAGLLVMQGGGRAVADRRQLADTLGEWLRDPTTRAAAGARAATMVRGGLGAAQRSVAVVEALLELA